MVMKLLSQLLPRNILKVSVLLWYKGQDQRHFSHYSLVDLESLRGRLSSWVSWKSAGYGHDHSAIRVHHVLLIFDDSIKQPGIRIFCVANIVTAHTGMRQCHGNPGLRNQIKQWIVLINLLIEKILLQIIEYPIWSRDPNTDK
jgi:hypothetical protein